MLLHSLARFEKAETVLTRAISKCPGLAYNYGLRGFNRLYLEDFSGAEADCTKCLELTPDDASIYSLRARVFYVMGDFERVVADLEKALELEPARCFSYVDCARLAEAYAALESYDKLIDLCTRSIDPKKEKYLSTELLERRAVARMKIGDDALALDDLTRAIEISPVSSLVDLYVLRADLHERTNNHEMAERDRLSASHLHTYKAQMAEWVPAKPQQRLIAKVVDASVVGLLSAVLFLVFGTICGLISSGIQTEFLNLAVWAPGAVTVLFVGMLDAIFPCIAPVLLLLCLPDFVSNSLPAIFASKSLVELINYLSGDPTCQMIPVILLVISANWLYHASFESSLYQSTPGKGACRLRITDRDGLKITFLRASLRHLLRTVPSFLIVFAVVALGFMTIGSGYPERFLGGAIFLFMLMLGVHASIRPGMHNSLTKCLVCDNFMYKPRLGLDSKGPDAAERL
ncbi:MAG: RDD family protein [Cyanobacteria bacterium]|nr:RDD family protein [Cyanobacteriota bacterium]